MTAPRRVVPGATLLISRRCLGRRFRLRPSKRTNQHLRFLLAVTARRYGIRIHGFCILSNHLHLVISDPSGTSPAFMRDFCALVARSFNARQGVWETFWAPGSYSAVTLSSPEDILDKLAYVLANPVAAGLVRRGAEWPGLRSAPAEIGGPTTRADRPADFFREGGPLPRFDEMEIVCPPGFESIETFRSRLEALVAVREEEAAQRRAAEGREFMGAASVLAQDPFSRPASEAPRRGLRPRIAAADKWRRIEAIGRLKEFLRSYREAWTAFASGVRGAVFPCGTYWMRVAYGVACAAAG